jgi:hypothetical protein
MCPKKTLFPAVQAVGAIGNGIISVADGPAIDRKLDRWL